LNADFLFLWHGVFPCFKKVEYHLHRIFYRLLNNRINAERAYIDAYTNGVNARNAINSEARQQCNYFQQTFQSNVPNWSRYRNNNEFIQWANKSTVQVNNGQNITVASAIDQIINTCSIRDMTALRSWLDAFDSNK
jgi:hypothetical protein